MTERYLRGEEHPMSKLEEEDVLEIKWMLEEGYDEQDIADDFCITRSHLWTIKKGKAWGWLEAS